MVLQQRIPTAQMISQFAASLSKQCMVLKTGIQQPKIKYARYGHRGIKVSSVQVISDKNGLREIVDHCDFFLAISGPVRRNWGAVCGLCGKAASGGRGQASRGGERAALGGERGGSWRGRGF